MKKYFFIVLFAIAFILISGSLFADYDRNIVVNAMRANAALMGELKTAVQEGDFYTAAVKFMGIALQK